MKKILFTALWMLAAFLVGCALFLAFLMAVGIILEMQGDSLSLPNKKRPLLTLINFLTVYGPPVIALVLGIWGKLPGTRGEKPKSGTSTPPTIPPLALGNLPPVIESQAGSKPPLTREMFAEMLERTIRQKFTQEVENLSPELLDALLLCVADKKTFNLTAAQTGRPSEQDLADFEQTIGFPLPQDFRDFAMTGFGCLYLEVNESVWPRPKEGAIVPAWHIMCALYVYGLSADVPDYMDIRKQYAVFSKGGLRLVPFFRREGYLDHYCFTPEGRIVLWRSETRDTEPVDLTFTALLLKEIQTLRERARKILIEPNPYA